jgi:hypothetical protein
VQPHGTASVPRKRALDPSPGNRSDLKAHRR